MNLDVAAVMGVPYSGCLACNEAVVVGPSSAEQITEAWATHRSGKVHLAGGFREPDPVVDMTPDDSFYDDQMRPIPSVAPTENVNDLPIDAYLYLPTGFPQS